MITVINLQIHVASDNKLSTRSTLLRLSRELVSALPVLKGFFHKNVFQHLAFYCLVDEVSVSMQQQQYALFTFQDRAHDRWWCTFEKMSSLDAKSKKHYAVVQRKHRALPVAVTHNLKQSYWCYSDDIKIMSHCIFYDSRGNFLRKGKDVL